jgi:RNA recognition motif-containing protein
LASGVPFVGFEKAEDAHAAVQKLDGQAIAGKKLKVQVQVQLQVC